jgi:hypothetical protein
MRVHLDQIVIDSQDPSVLVRFWAALLGGEPANRAHNWSHVEPPGFPKLSFQPVDEAKTVKNRLHIDLEVDPGCIPVAVAHALELGANRIGEPVVGALGTFQVMVDPESNEFCFVG